METNTAKWLWKWPDYTALCSLLVGSLTAMVYRVLRKLFWFGRGCLSLQLMNFSSLRNLQG